MPGRKVSRHRQATASALQQAPKWAEKKCAEQSLPKGLRAWEGRGAGNKHCPPPAPLRDPFQAHLHRITQLVRVGSSAGEASRKINAPGWGRGGLFQAAETARTPAEAQGGSRSEWAWGCEARASAPAPAPATRVRPFLAGRPFWHQAFLPRPARGLLLEASPDYSSCSRATLF